MAGDGQVSLGNTVMKGNARKVRRLYHDKILAGFAGGTADAFTLFERFEAKLEAQGSILLASKYYSYDLIRGRRKMNEGCLSISCSLSI